MLISGSSPCNIRVPSSERPDSMTFAKIRIYDDDIVELTQNHPVPSLHPVMSKVGHKIFIGESEIRLYFRFNSISLVSQVFYSYTSGQSKLSFFISCLFILVANLNIEMRIEDSSEKSKSKTFQRNFANFRLLTKFCKLNICFSLWMMGVIASPLVKKCRRDI